MEDFAVNSVVIIRGIACVGSIIAGLICARLGFRLFLLDLKHSEHSSAKFKFGKIEASSQSAGAVVIIASLIWACIAFFIAPSIETRITIEEDKKIKSQKVYNLPKPNVDRTIVFHSNVPYIISKRVKNAEMIIQDQDDLVQTFVNALRGQGNVEFKVNYEPASIEYESLSVREYASDGMLIRFTVRPTNFPKRVEVHYQAETISQERILFTPLEPKIVDDDTPENDSESRLEMLKQLKQINR